MRTSDDDFLFTKKSSETLDSQIKNFKKSNSNAKTSAETPSESPDSSFETNTFLKSLENKFKIIDEKNASKSFFKYVQVPDESNKFIKHLMKPLKSLTPDEELILFYFLQTAISYTVKFSPKEECNLETLIFLALMLRDDTTRKEVDDPLFDLFIKDDLDKPTDKNNSDLILYYERFCAHRNEKTAGMILKNVLKIAIKFKPYKQ